MANIKLISFFLFIWLVSCSGQDLSETEITKWPHNKSGAVSLTFDDSTINHFRVALPMLNDFGFPGTFYLITGAIPESEHQGEFVGRDVNEIIAETAETPTNKENFFERASAVRYLGYQDVHQYHREAGQLFESGQTEEAYDAIDEGYRQVREGEFKRGEAINQYLNNVLFVDPGTELITWKELKTFDGDFHEFGSHTVTHPYLAVLDEANIRYELERSREDISRHLGEEHIFSVEGPFGTENERVMKYLYEIYPASRNRMPEPFLEELNRGSVEDPAGSDKEYVQWQRGPLTDTPMDLMKSWVETTANHDNIWLVLVFHGIEGIGWEPKSEAEMEEFLTYISQYEEDLWVATFKDATKYIRQRMNADVTTNRNGDKIAVELKHDLGEMYDLPMTLKTYVSFGTGEITIRQDETETVVQSQEDEQGWYVVYQAQPNAGVITIE